MRLATLSAFVALGVHLAEAKVYNSLDELLTSRAKKYDFVIVGGESRHASLNITCG
jgi:hypothetical protein